MLADGELTKWRATPGSRTIVQNVRLCGGTRPNAKSLQFLIPQNRFGAPSAVQSVNSALGYLASHGLTLLGITGHRIRDDECRSVSAASQSEPLIMWGFVG